MGIALHTRKTLFLLAETAAVFAGLAALALAALGLPPCAAWPLIGLLAVAQGLWLDRMYTVAHEAVHMKLFPGRRRLNDLVGSILMVPVVAPFTIFRKIHGFHHGANRRDRETAALDHFRLPPNAPPALERRRQWLWRFYVFGGGFFLHTLATILIFLFVPERRAVKISPVFRGWPMPLRLRAWAQFGAGIAVHAAVAAFLGSATWLALLGLPMLAFAWIWSMLLYIYHYRTSVGPDVRHNVRSLPRQPFFSWLLLNFNEHATHHRDPSIPWYALPARRYALPPSHAANQDVATLFDAVRRQRRGPILWTGEGS
ncbi:MAG TPA: fatty acid desaturase [Allosphingosinicella sp.]